MEKTLILLWLSITILCALMAAGFTYVDMNYKSDDENSDTWTSVAVNILLFIIAVVNLVALAFIIYKVFY